MMNSGQQGRELGELEDENQREGDTKEDPRTWRQRKENMKEKEKRNKQL